MTTERFPIVIGNAVGVEKGEKFGETVLNAAAASRHKAKIIAMVEADAIDLDNRTIPRNLADKDARRQIVESDIWAWRHRDENVSKDGCMLMWDKRLVREFRKPYWEIASTNTLRNGTHVEMNTRWMLTVYLEFLMPNDAWHRQPITVVHFPPPRFPELRARAAGAVSHKQLFVGDLNLSTSALRRKYPNRQIRGTEVIHAVAKPNVNLGRSQQIRLADSDHPGVIVPLILSNS